jgi:hypothetical protein
MQDRIESLIGGLENCIENAKLRGDAYDVGYMSAMVTEARALLADGGKDSERMDWLCERVINVRDPLPYGSRDMFWSSPTDDDGGHEPSNLRAQIDAAIAKEKK